MHSRLWGLLFLSLVSLAAGPGTLGAQRGRASDARTVEIDPPRLTIEVGQRTMLRATVRDAGGEVLNVPVLFLTGSPRSLGVTRDGGVEALAPGTYTIVVRVPGGGQGRDFLTAEVEVVVPFPPLDRVEVTGLSEPLYTGTLVRPEYALYDVSGGLRSDPIQFSVADASVAEVDSFGQITPHTAGSTVMRLTAGDFTREIPVRVEPNPVHSIVVDPSAARARTGDVVRFQVQARDAGGREVEGVPVVYTVEGRSSAWAGVGAWVAPDGRFVAEQPGSYTVIASAGTAFATATIEIAPRNVERTVEVIGRGPVREYHSSDLWVWEGDDGRDYAMTGTWGANGDAYVWDVTAPEDIVRIDTVRVDARTVNDVKVSADGRLGVLTREGASDRRNGIVLLDVSDPSGVRILSGFDAGLTGGVHNAFIHDDHVYAVNNGTRYDVINVAEPAMPFRVASFELETPGHSVHDVWIDDGIAYSSNWEDGVVLADVGNGIAGGAPDRPVRFASWSDDRGDTHAAFPFRSRSTGRFYVVVGEESFPNGFNPEGPTEPAGYMHIVDFTDFDNPVEVARFEVPEAGSHNIWVEDDVLYAAFYNGGLRIVDVSGELMGDLYEQGREIARFVPKDPSGVVANEAMVWGAQPHKGVIYVSDWNSGLWAVRLGDQVAGDE